MITTGENLSHYKILSAIGAGGMGEVFLAADTKLDRKVALKILPEEFAEDAERMRRFVREAKSASALNHPNIITIYEIGEAGGTNYIATEFIEGKTLSKKLAGETMNLKTALEISIQIASALDAAHSAGIVHRDIKPDNVMIRPDGLVKILDFGIAKLTERRRDEEAERRSEDADTLISSSLRPFVSPSPKTEPGMIIGTANYMSPEQANGKEVDARTDVFSFGVVLYQMIAGRLPFEGETAMEMIGAILHKEPLPLDNVKAPPEIEKIIGKCLRKKAGERYQTIKDVCNDLKQMQMKLLVEAEIERTGSPNLKEAATQIIKPQKTARDETRSSIAVLPFTSLSADEENEYFCDGLAEELLNALAKIEDLRVAARTSAFSFKNKMVEAGEIGRALNVKTILEGSVRKSGNRLRITVQLINASDGYHLWSERYDREMQDIFDVQDEITLSVVDALKVKLLGAKKAALLKRYTNNTEAYELYLKGRYNYNKYSPEHWHKAIEYFEKAIAIEPEYAPAFAGIGFCYGALWYFGFLSAHEIIPKWRAIIVRGLEIDGELAEAHLSLASIHFYYDWNWAGAERDYRRAIELNPNSPDAHWRYGMFLTSQERFEQAIGNGRRALELDPLSLVVNYFMGCIYWFADRLDDALEQSRKMIELEPNFALAYLMRGVVLIAKGTYREAVEALQKSVSLSSSPWIVSNLGAAYALAGERERSLDVLDQLLEIRQGQYNPAFNIARVYVELGDLDKTFEWLEKALEERDGELVFFKRLTAIGTAWGENFRQDERYQNILRRVGLPIDETAPRKTTSETSEAQTVALSSGELKSEQSDDLQAQNANAEPNSEQTANPKSKIQNPKSKWWLLGLLGLILIVSGFFAYRYFTSTKQIESIAVMPFVNESGNADAEYLSDGMTETLINNLSQLPNLYVKARSSVFRYKGKETNPQAIGKELNVQAILNGRIAQRGEQLILSLELIDSQTENVIWSETYNRRETDLVSLQSEIARDVSGKLKSKLSGADQAKVAKTYTQNAEAYRLYLQGRFYWNKREEKEFRKAIEYYNQAIALDSNYALAFAGLADAYALLATFGLIPPSEGMTKAREFAHRALSLDESLAEPHATLGVTLLSYGYDFAGAEREYRRAIELDPNYLTAHQWYGEMLTCAGRFEEAFAEYRRALELDPLSLPVNWEYARSFYYARKFDESIAQHRKMFELDAGFAVAHRTLSEVYRAKGDYAKAVEEQAIFYELSGEPQNAALLREAFAKGGWNGYLRVVTAENSPLKFRHAIVARAHLQLGEKDKAFAELDKAYEMRESPIQWLKVEPQFDPLRSDPRFQELLNKVGFP